MDNSKIGLTRNLNKKNADKSKTRTVASVLFPFHGDSYVSMHEGRDVGAVKMLENVGFCFKIFC